MVLGVHLANGQQTSTKSSQAVNLSSELLFKLPAELLYEGNNLVPTGKLKVKTYRLEKVNLPSSFNMSFKGKTVVVESVIRLTITGETFQPGAYTIWIDDESQTDVMHSATELVTVIYDRSLLQQGATLAVSYDTLGDSRRTVLPETLSVPADAKGIDQGTEDEITITRIRLNRARATDSISVIEIELTSRDVFEARNSERVFQIGEFETYGSNPPDGDGYKWIIRMPLEVFEKLEDGSAVFVKAERGKRGMHGARIITRLNKHLLEK
ncbi:MAG: hypothetical protein ACR2H4_07570 [Pyrinomonadaceae bacterium]